MSATSRPLDPDNDAETRRLAALKSLMVLDSSPEKAYDDLARTAAQLCGTPVALISLIDAERQWFKARIGTDVLETPREIAFCSHTIRSPTDVLVVSDATKDARFVNNPLVTADPNIRFYAGAPLVTSSGEAIGTLCVIDTKPHAEVSKEALDMLQFLARQVVDALELRAKRQAEHAGDASRVAKS